MKHRLRAVHRNGIQEVGGSIPLSSINKIKNLSDSEGGKPTRYAECMRRAAARLGRVGDATFYAKTAP